MRAQESGAFASDEFSLRESIRFAFEIADDRHRRSLRLTTAVLTIVGLVDVVAVLALGVGSSWLLASSTGTRPGNLPISISFLDPQSPSFDLLKAAIVLFAVGLVLLLSRTLLSIVGTRSLVTSAYAMSSDYTKQLWSRLLHAPDVVLAVRNSNDAVFAVNYGVTGGVANAIVASVLLIADAFLVTVLAVTVLVLSPIAGLIASLIFGVAALFFVRLVAPKSQKMSAQVARQSVEVDTIVRDGLNGYKEVVTAGQVSWLEGRISPVRKSQTENQGDLNFLQILPRYAAEIVLVVSLGAVALGVVTTSSQQKAAALLVAYAAAASRILPAVVRIQASIVTLRSGSGLAEGTRRYADAVAESASRLSDEVVPAPTGPLGVKVSSLAHHYQPGHPTLRNIDLAIEAGQRFALVGPSGAGKSTLVNIILGLLEPTGGDVAIGMVSSSRHLYTSGRIAYVAQDSWLHVASLRDNITMGRSFSDEQVLDALTQVGLAQFAGELPLGLDTVLDEQGGNLSGGQRQRLGLARALISQPGLLVLDEATSALDARSEADISGVVARLKGSCTVIVVAHRLQTVVTSDQVAYLEAGEIKGAGTFLELQKSIPKLAEQAMLGGVMTSNESESDADS